MDTQYLGHGNDFCPSIFGLVALTPLANGCHLIMEGFKDGLIDGGARPIDTQTNERTVGWCGIVSEAAVPAVIVTVRSQATEGVMLGLRF